MAKYKRKPLTKKIRFEVFKRDSFTCQYCGQSAPEVVLHVDHIMPVKEGGTNDIMNLVTACVGCNQGKGARVLSDKSAVKASLKQAKNHQQKLEQIKMMASWQKDLREQRDAELETIKEVFFSPINENWIEILGESTWCLSEKGNQMVYKWIRQFGFKEVINAISISHEYYLECGEDEAYTKESVNNSFNKIGGICFNRKQRGEV